MNDVLEVRRALDALCVELACDRISQEELQHLKKACDTFEEAVKTKDVKQIAQADVALHDIIVEATGNQRLIQLVNNLSEQMYRYRFEYIKDSSQHERLVEEHKVIYESIVKRIRKRHHIWPRCISTTRKRPSSARSDWSGKKINNFGIV